MTLEHAFIGILAFTGILISFYFSAVYHRFVHNAERFVPKFCRIEPGTCASLLETRQARLFGIPNFDLGIFYYTALLGSVLLPPLWTQLRTLLLMGSLLTVPVAVYLVYVLLFRLKVSCVLCLASHAINCTIVLLLLTSP